MKKILKEQIGIEDFLSTISDNFPDSVYVMEFMVDFIKKSNCKRIEFADFSISAYGASLDDRVILNNEILKLDLINVLYVIFHEIAHQYQYKKYGKEKMYSIYTGKITPDEGAIWLKNVEEVADDFAFRKLRELSKKNDYVKNNFKKLKKVYLNIPTRSYVGIIENIINLFKKSGLDETKENIGEVLYNNFVRVKK